uniref:Uncharacterized protein n=1 Tax=Pelusios castaneus TaxID=367368 RepID=A0A8C8T1B8_9SAUR
LLLLSLGRLGAPKGAVGHIILTEKSILAVERNKVLIPPLWNKTFCWGFDDFTCCLGNYRSDKSTFENLILNWGKCLCAICPTPTTVITSGTSAVVCVWELSLAKDKVRCLNLRQALYGHTQAVTCLAASVSYSIIVSGSNDRTCIIWDLNQLTYVAHLPAHGACLSAVGDIASCAGSDLYLWTINGQLLASISTTCGLGHIVCCCFADVMDWDTRSIIVTGGTDGIVRVGVSHTSDCRFTPPITPGLWPPSAPQAFRGNKWGKHLLLCRELNISIALTGKPAKNNPAVTALAIPRNSSKLLVGDERGRIYCCAVEG